MADNQSAQQPDQSSGHQPSRQPPSRHASVPGSSGQGVTVTDQRGAGAGRVLDALPVRLRLSGPDAEAIRRWVESVVGWQAVEPDTHGLAAEIEFRDVAASPTGGRESPPGDFAAQAHGVARAGGNQRRPDARGDGRRGGDHGGSIPVVALVTDTDDPRGAARAARHADAVVAWPDQRDRLADTVSGLLDDPVAADPDRRGLRVGGAAGGVGTTTVASAVAGLAAWRGLRTVVVVRSGDADPATAAAVAGGARGWQAGEDVPGITGLRRLVIPPGLDTASMTTGEIGLVVHDLGAGTDVDLLVLRRDRDGLAGLRATTAGMAVVTDLGPAPVAAVKEAAAGRRILVVPWSARVARAGFAGRLPAGLPGRWLRRLAPVLSALSASPARNDTRRPVSGAVAASS